VSAREVVSGVYEIKVLSRWVRIIVLSQLSLAQRNAILAFFSFDPGKVKFALDNYKWRMEDGSTVISQLLEKYSLEGIAMPYTMEQFQKEYIKAHLGMLDPEEVLSRFKPEERLKGLKAEERLKGIKIEEVELYLKKLKKKD